MHSKVTTGTPIYTLRGNSVAPEAAPAAGEEETVTVPSPTPPSRPAWSTG